MKRIQTRRVAQTTYYNGSGQHLGQWSKVFSGEYVQTNLIILNPNTFDGWYIHGDRDEWHVCIKGDVLIAVGELGAEPSGDTHGQAVFTPKLVPHGIYNASDESAWVLVFSDQPHQLSEDEFSLPVYTTDLMKLETIWDHCYGIEDEEKSE